MPAVVITLLCLFLTLARTDDDDSPVVELEEGTLKGMKTVSIREQDFYAFLGVPYAKPPVGYLRFKAPRPLEPWTGTYEANEEKTCPQVGLLSSKIEGTEDCLYLNIFTTKMSSTPSELMPVMVWIHGGNFVTGSGTSMMFGPDHLLKENVVLVAINYRLGMLGFMCLRDAGIPGNNGMKDQVIALKWVKKNIDKFGGDPKRVTIFGQSTGAACVHLHTMSPMTAGLFHRAIAQSGTALASWAFAEPEYLAQVAFKIGSKIGCNTTDANALVKCFMGKPALAFVNITAFQDDTGISTVELRPTWEDGSTEEPYLPGRPLDLIENKKFQIVPFMTGINSKEALTFLEITKAPNFWEKFDKNFDKIVDTSLGRSTSSNSGYEKIKQFYFKDKKPSPETEDAFVDCYSDMNYLIGAELTVRKQSFVSTAPIYYYYFQFDGALGIAKRAVKLTKPGVAHADELGYIFNTAISPELQQGSDEMKTLLRVVKMWTNFAKTGDPSSELNSDLTVKWEPTTKKDPVYLEIGKELAMKRDMLKQRWDLWKDVV